ncbi:MAG: transcription-repair coupling factor [Clostridiaceae bacterium]|nr:transcription-repair coupling factor [Clostridiaceae bacterium]
MRFNGLLQPLKESKEFKDILVGIEKNRYPIGIFGLSESSRSYLIEGIYDEKAIPFVVVTSSDVEAKNIYEDLSLYSTDVFYFPSKEVVFYNIDAISGDLRWERLKVIRQMMTNKKKIIVCSIEAFIGAYIPVNLYREYTYKFSVGDIVDLRKFSEQLVQAGYERAEMVEGKGQFSLRGGILDIYSPIENMPYRIEFFGDEVDSIRSFNLQSQRSIDKIKKVEIFPAKEIILNALSIAKGSAAMQKELDIIIEGSKNKKDKEIFNSIKETTNTNLELLKENWSFENIDSFLPYFYEKTSTFFDYIGECIIVMDDVQRCKGKLDSVYFEFEESYKHFLERGNILPKQGELLTKKDYVLDKFIESKVVTLNIIPKSTSILAPKAIISFTEITLHNYHGQLELLIEDILDKKKRGFKTVILSGTRPRGERLVNTLRDRGIESTYKDVIKDIQGGEVVITFGNLLKGFEYPELKVCVISDKEVFGQSKIKAVNKSNKKGIGKIKSFAELKLGDYVVHTNHGIGVFRGIKQLEVEGHKKDYLHLSYDGKDTLYVPVEQLDFVQKYIGSEGKNPKINKLGGQEWIKAKSKVRNSINEIAEELLKLYAERSTLNGFVYSKDTVWQKQFEEEFPYEETADQLTAVEDIKGDMESNKPMDRLLCGDVGYGKTEVAIRAAFKAVMDGKQVALLVPTTILAEQHYNNLVQRFSDFPVKIDMISRFRTPAQQKITIKSVKDGNVDILIGTHRIIQKDIQFKELGLLIVDEEQRFGVTHKEKIKNLKKNVDVLTLTATPIPRTLHMSLIGVRDISVIETAPEERHPIQTYVVEYNEQLIRDGIMRELNRGGQVYFVYNRVESIGEMSSYISKLVPEARVAIAHGQMTERELEKVILNFVKNEIDILVCTTIIETGMDIQNVNTMIIYDSDKMGLSQLYQLRGRVGRSNRIAYAYFTYKKDKILTEVAEKRLKAIKDFTELGSGFKIALRDLEIRGAGNMMGSAQHGHMASVGYDLYCRMLEDTIKHIKGDIQVEKVETTVELKLDAYIPGTYIKDETQKIEVYKKIAAISSKEDMMEIQEEIEDRFSNIPLSVYNLMEISYIRAIAGIIGIEEVKEKDDEVLLKFDSGKRLNEELIAGINNKYRNILKFKITDKPILAYKINGMKKDIVLKNLCDIIEYMKSVVERN